MSSIYQGWQKFPNMTNDTSLSDLEKRFLENEENVENMKWDDRERGRWRSTEVEGWGSNIQ